jgi:hypothetical protein
MGDDGWWYKRILFGSGVAFLVLLATPKAVTTGSFLAPSGSVQPEPVMDQTGNLALSSPNTLRALPPAVLSTNPECIFLLFSHPYCKALPHVA